MTSSKSTSMAELLAKHKTTFVTVHKGDIVKGVITKLSSSEILLDINTKTEAVVLEKDRNLVRALLSMLNREYCCFPPSFPGRKIVGLFSKITKRTRKN
jgi:hypothetical protein